MTLKECYHILGLSQKATLEDIKHAYRKRAFELHPDLNPNVADASQRFQKLNESYVILSKIVALREAKEAASGKNGTARSDARQSANASARNAAQDAARDTDSGDGKEAEKDARQDTRQNTRQDDQTRREQADGRRQEEAGDRESAQSQESAGAAGEREAGQTQKEQKDAASGESLYAEQQEVLQDILNDPFARRVFEDIYSEIRKQGPEQGRTGPRTAAPGSGGYARNGGTARTAGTAGSGGNGGAGRTAQTRQVAKPKPPSNSLAGRLGRAGLGWGKRKLGLDFSKGVGGALRDWLRSQIDEEQLFELPARRLVPGARIRLQIRHGFSDEVTTLDVTLPPDFRLDKPIRLKGMGKKLGSWQGDLYLRFSSKD